LLIMIHWTMRKDKITFDILSYRYGDLISHIVKQVVSKDQDYDKILASTTAFGKDVIPRVGGLIDI
jgi:hypothetical protein